MAIGITEQDVWKAADQLLLEGQRPTIERVRQKIGRGSPNTVQPYLDTWFKGLGARIQDPLAFAAPSNVPDRVQQAAEHFWAMAQADARASVMADHAAERQQLAQERDALEESRKALALQEATMAARLEAAVTSLNLVTVQFDESRQREVASQQALSTLNQRNTDLDTALASLREQYEQSRASFDAERRELTERARSQEHHWLQELDRQRQAFKEAKQHAAERDKQTMAKLAAMETRTLAAEREALDLQSVRTELSQAQEAVTRGEQALEELQSLLSRERERINELQSALAELRRQQLGKSVGRMALHVKPLRKRLGR